MNAILYIHGKGGNAAESEHYKPLFPDCKVIGLDYQTFSDLKGTECGVAITPWETGQEIRIAVEDLKSRFENVILIANSIGAFFSMIATPHFDHGSKNAGIDDMIQKAYFISPIVNMEKLITDMMKWANVTEQELESRGVIHTDFGEDLSWKYLNYVRSHPIEWHVPTQILYGSNDHLTSLETITDFANKHNAILTIMEGGEHWFHTEKQMKFLDNWIKESRCMTLRPFTIDDAPIILSWIKDKTAFRKWSADRYPVYPPKPEDMVAQYESDVIFPFTAIDDDGEVVGHIMLRYPDSSKAIIRFGFVIVDDQLRGKSYGKQMLQMAIQKATHEFGAKKITLGVFDNNPSAFHCYESVGFKVIGTDSYSIDGEEWTGKEMEI